MSCHDRYDVAQRAGFAIFAAATPGELTTPSMMSGTSAELSMPRGRVTQDWIKARCKLAPLQTNNMPRCRACITHHLMHDTWNPAQFSKGPQITIGVCITKRTFDGSRDYMHIYRTEKIVFLATLQRFRSGSLFDMNSACENSSLHHLASSLK